MPPAIEMPKPEEVAGYPENAHAVIVMTRERCRVIERKYFWDKAKKRGCEKRTYLGYIVNNQYYANEEYEKKFKRNGKERLTNKTTVAEAVQGAYPDPLGSVVAAEMPLYYQIAKDLGLIEDMLKVWTVPQTNAALSLAFFLLSTQTNAFYLYSDWAEKKYLPYSEPLSSKDISEFLEEIVNVPGWRKKFFAARVARLPDSEMLSFDATQIATEAEKVTYAQIGVGKEGGYQKQVGLILLVGHDSHLPVLFRVLPGNITDVTTVPDMLFRFDEIADERRVFAAVLDRGYFSLKNFVKFVDSKSRVIIAAKKNAAWIRECMDQAITHLWDNSSRIRKANVWGHTIEHEITGEDGAKRKLFVHVYRDESMSNIENAKFYGDLEKFEDEWMSWKDTGEECPLLKSRLMKYFVAGVRAPGKVPLVQNDDAIDAKTRYFGLFANVTTHKCDARTAYTEYGLRDIIEKTFKGGKSDAEMDAVRSHYDDTLEGRLLISFIAMTILSRIRLLMSLPTYIVQGKTRKEVPPLADSMTFNQVRLKLADTRLVYDSQGNKRWEEITGSQHEIARRLGYTNLYRDIPTWGR